MEIALPPSDSDDDPRKFPPSSAFTRQAEEPTVWCARRTLDAFHGEARKGIISAVLADCDKVWKALFERHVADKDASGDAGHGTLDPKVALQQAKDAKALPDGVCDALYLHWCMRTARKHHQVTVSTGLGPLFGQGAASAAEGAHACCIALQNAASRLRRCHRHYAALRCSVLHALHGIACCSCL